MDLYYFNNKEELLGIIPIERQIRHEQSQNLNGLINMHAEILYDERVEEATYIGHKDIDEEKVFHLYYIDQMNLESKVLTIEGTHVFFDDLQAEIVRDMRPKNLGVGEVLTKLLKDSRWELGLVNSNHVASSNFYYISKLEAFWKVIEAWRIEFKPRLEFSGNKITRRVLDISDKISDDFGKRYEYGDKLLHIVKETAKESIYTAFVGRGKGEEKFDEETGETTGAYGRRIGFENVEWSTAKGDPVDKPKGQDFIEFEDATKAFGYSNGSPRTKVEIFEDIEDEEELLSATYEFGLANSRPHVQFKSNVYDDNRVDLGETVSIIRDDLGIRYKTRVFKLTRDFILKGKKSFEFGDKLTESTATRTKSIINHIKREEESRLSLAEEMMRQLTLSFFNEDGYNYNFHAGNEYGLPGGYYSFDRPIDKGPTKVVYMGAGKILIANSKNPDGSWKFRTAATGDGLVATEVTTGILNADLIKAGLLSDLLGNFTIDMENGNINIGDKFIYNSKSGELTILGYADDADLQGVKTELKQTSESILQRVQGAEDSIADLEIKDGQIIASVEDKVGKTDYTPSVIIGKINEGRGVQISGDRLDLRGRHITLDGNTEVMGSFKVGDANIKNLSAETITTGTLKVNSSGTHTGTLNNKSATFSGSSYNAKLSGSSTSFNANSNAFSFNYGTNSFEVKGRIGANPGGNRHAIEINGLTLHSDSGSFKSTSRGYELKSNGELNLRGSTIKINGKEIYDNGNGGWASR